MNNKGQSLVLFVILLPVIMIIFAYIFDFSLTAIEKRKLDNIAETSIRYMYKEKTEEEIRNYIKKNNESIIIKKLDINNLEIELDTKIDSFFGKTIGYDTYDIKSNFQGKITKNKLEIEKR